MEIHMGGQVSLAGLGQRIGEGVALAGPAACRRRPDPNSRNRRSAPRRRSAREPARESLVRSHAPASGRSRTSPVRTAELEDRSPARSAGRRSTGRRRARRAARTSRALSRRTGGSAGHRRTRWRSGGWARGNVLEAVVPDDRGCPRRPGLARCRSRKAGLVSTRWTERLRGNRAAIRGGAQGIGHQGAAARARARSGERGGPPHACQTSSSPQADQLPEHLADFRRGGEVAGRAERVAGARSSAEGRAPCSARP